MSEGVRAVGGLTYLEGERVLTRHGWGTVTAVREETYPPEITDEVTFECTIQLDKPTSLGGEEVVERNPRKDYRYGVFTHFWGIGDPKTQTSTVEEFLPSEKAEAHTLFESADMASGQLLIVIVDYESGKAETRMLTTNGEVARHPAG